MMMIVDFRWGQTSWHPPYASDGVPDPLLSLPFKVLFGGEIKNTNYEHIFTGYLRS